MSFPEAEEIRLVDDFPRTAAGKIHKVALGAWLRSDPPPP
jgi:acyl-coenzyme A synthetase/AMP-(fatty) acid ligase